MQRREIDDQCQNYLCKSFSNPIGGARTIQTSLKRKKSRKQIGLKLFTLPPPLARCSCTWCCWAGYGCWRLTVTSVRALVPFADRVLALFVMNFTTYWSLLFYAVFFSVEIMWKSMEMKLICFHCERLPVGFIYFLLMPVFLKQFTFNLKLRWLIPIKKSASLAIYFGEFQRVEVSRALCCCKIT